MLSTIYIENIAVIEKASVDFSSGFNVFTGETGAGKSIIIDAINAVLGQRTSKDIIRNGAEKATVTAVFCELSSENIGVLEEKGFYPDEDGLFILHREIYISGRNICKINGIPVNVSTLRDIGTRLITIHGQHESYELLSPDIYTEYLDNMGKLKGELDAYHKAYQSYKEARKRYTQTQSDDSQRLRRIDILRYTVDELERAELEVGETQQLEARLLILRNIELIEQCVYKAQSLLKGDDTAAGIISDVKSCGQALSEASQYQPALEALASRLDSVYYELDDIFEELSQNESSDENIYEELDYTEKRLDLLYTLCRKYGGDESELLKTLEKSKAELDQLENYDYNREKLEKEYLKCKDEAQSLAESISKKRKKLAQDFTKRVTDELKFLDMPSVGLKFTFEGTQLSEMGIDKTELLICTNIGEEYKPVYKIASGGELSRIMLAIKSVLSDSDMTQSLIFDEIDTGISGGAAQKVGLKLKGISSDRQVLCITHQAQIASLATTHFLIKKLQKDGRSFTKVTELDFDDRVQELARIMGGVNISAITLEHARELLTASEIN